MSSLYSVQPRPVDVRPDVDRVRVHGLLWGHVVERAHHLAAASEFLAGRLAGLQPGQAEVENLYRGQSGIGSRQSGFTP